VTQPLVKEDHKNELNVVKIAPVATKRPHPQLIPVTKVYPQTTKPSIIKINICKPKNHNNLSSNIKIIKNSSTKLQPSINKPTKCDPFFASLSDIFMNETQKTTQQETEEDLDHFFNTPLLQESDTFLSPTPTSVSSFGSFSGTNLSGTGYPMLSDDNFLFTDLDDISQGLFPQLT